VTGSQSLTAKELAARRGPKGNVANTVNLIKRLSNGNVEEADSGKNKPGKNKPGKKKWIFSCAV
jgi:hypothetical protein